MVFGGVVGSLTVAFFEDLDGVVVVAAAAAFLGVAVFVVVVVVSAGAGAVVVGFFADFAGVADRVDLEETSTSGVVGAAEAIFLTVVGVAAAFLVTFDADVVSTGALVLVFFVADFDGVEEEAVETTASFLVDLEGVVEAAAGDALSLVFSATTDFFATFSDDDDDAPLAVRCFFVEGSADTFCVCCSSSSSSSSTS